MLAVLEENAPARSDRVESSSRARVIAIVPVWNEQSTIGRVVRSLMLFGADRVIVVDNGSSDSSARRARLAGADVVHEPVRGYGSACMAGLRAAAAAETDIVVFADGDGSDVLEDLPRVLAPIKSEDFELVVGARRALPPLRWHVRAGNRAATALLAVLFGTRYTDLGPLRAVRWRALEAMGLREARCGWTVEMQVRAAQLGIAASEVPVRYRPRTTGSKISGTLGGSLRAAQDILLTILRLAWSGRKPARCD